MPTRGCACRPRRSSGTSNHGARCQSKQQPTGHLSAPGQTHRARGRDESPLRERLALRYRETCRKQYPIATASEKTCSKQRFCEFLERRHAQLADECHRLIARVIGVKRHRRETATSLLRALPGHVFARLAGDVSVKEKFGGGHASIIGF